MGKARDDKRDYKGKVATMLQFGEDITLPGDSSMLHFIIRPLLSPHFFTLLRVYISPRAFLYCDTLEIRRENTKECLSASRKRRGREIYLLSCQPVFIYFVIRCNTILNVLTEKILHLTILFY